MAGLFAYMYLGVLALWTSTLVVVDAAYFHRKWTSADEAKELLGQYFDSKFEAETSSDVVGSESQAQEMAQRIIEEAREVELQHAMDVEVYHTLTPLNFVTARIFGAIARDKEVS